MGGRSRRLSPGVLPSSTRMPAQLGRAGIRAFHCNRGLAYATRPVPDKEPDIE